MSTQPFNRGASTLGSDNGYSSRTMSIPTSFRGGDGATAPSPAASAASTPGPAISPVSSLASPPDRATKGPAAALQPVDTSDPGSVAALAAAIRRRDPRPVSPRARPPGGAEPGVVHARAASYEDGSAYADAPAGRKLTPAADHARGGSRGSYDNEIFPASPLASPLASPESSPKAGAARPPLDGDALANRTFDLQTLDESDGREGEIDLCGDSGWLAASPGAARTEVEGVSLIQAASFDVGSWEDGEQDGEGSPVTVFSTQVVFEEGNADVTLGEKVALPEEKRADESWVSFDDKRADESSASLDAPATPASNRSSLPHAPYPPESPRSSALSLSPREEKEQRRVEAEAFPDAGLSWDGAPETPQRQPKETPGKAPEREVQQVGAKGGCCAVS
ncbi:hypothetical protein TeGR_g5208 [Tetraparma gracilis]|uniref:Uncharacterized protein n=1 Tax=Tetraparma gracilis TaxID=2962635 RepID=A0ABQ6M4Q7_9STRA|nr:hypothetical protein TeGR_g5208 [Tetraparma gracilis]